MHRTLFLLISLFLTGVAFGQDGKYRAPRTESGQPDLQGVWNFSSAVPLQRPAAFADKKVVTKEEFDRQRAALRNALMTIIKFVPVEDVGLDWMDSTPRVQDLRSSLISYPENGRLPALLEGVRRMPGPEDFIALLAESKSGAAPPPQLASLLAAFTGGKKNSYTDFSLSERCLFGAAVPLLPQLDGNYVQIVQGTDHVVLISDFWRRIVTLAPRRQASDALRTWSGTSSGRWDGDTLVVETTHFNDRMPGFAGAGTSHDKVVTERFTRTSGNTIQYAATIVAPKTFKDRIELSFPMTSVEARIYEAACHEGNYSLPLALSGARKEDEAAKTK
jgi:hypothetical protein